MISGSLMLNLPRNLFTSKNMGNKFFCFKVSEQIFQLYRSALKKDSKTKGIQNNFKATFQNTRYFLNLESAYKYKESCARNVWCLWWTQDTLLLPSKYDTNQRKVEDTSFCVNTGKCYIYLMRLGTIWGVFCFNMLNI